MSIDCANEAAAAAAEGRNGGAGGRNVEDDVAVDELEDVLAGDEDDEAWVVLVNGGSWPNPEEHAAARFDRNKLLRLFKYGLDPDGGGGGTGGGGGGGGNVGGAAVGTDPPPPPGEEAARADAIKSE